MPFFRVRTAFPGLPVIPHCKDIRFRVIAGYPDYGSSYHFYGIVRRRPQKGCFLRPLLPSDPACAVRFSGPLPGDEKACGHNRAAGFPEQALLPFGERYSASSTNTALS